MRPTSPGVLPEMAFRCPVCLPPALLTRSDSVRRRGDASPSGDTALPGVLEDSRTPSCSSSCATRPGKIHSEEQRGTRVGEGGDRSPFYAARRGRGRRRQDHAGIPFLTGGLGHLDSPGSSCSSSSRQKVFLQNPRRAAPPKHIPFEPGGGLPSSARSLLPLTSSLLARLLAPPQRRALCEQISSAGGQSRKKEPLRYDTKQFRRHISTSSRRLNIFLDRQSVVRENRQSFASCYDPEVGEKAQLGEGAFGVVFKVRILRRGQYGDFIIYCQYED